jgi:plastocyanin
MTMHVKIQRFATACACSAAVVLAGCSTKSEGSEASPSSVASAPTTTATTGPQTPDPGGKVITVELLTDEQGNNIFRPAELEAKKGDVIRYTLVNGVHNAHFLPDSNPKLAGLPNEEPLLQLPGQTHDVKVTFDPGKYYFHCDPHALLGMKGHVVVK